MGSALSGFAGGLAGGAMGSSYGSYGQGAGTSRNDSEE
jgi:hypothetical protein